MASLITLPDVIIVGGGPAGLRVARKVAKAGYGTLVLEEDRVIGSPVQCAGLVSTRVVEMTGTKSVIGDFCSATIHPPNAAPLEIASSIPKAHVLDRCAFDREMAKKAVKEGAEMRLGCRVTGWDRDGKIFFNADGEKHTTCADVVIGADGPNSLLRRLSDIPVKGEHLPGIQAVVGKEPNGIHIYIGNNIAPGFFAWELPHPAGTTVGLATDAGNAYDYLMKLLERIGLERKVIALQAGTIPFGKLEKSVEDGFMLVGDAAYQVKPLSGGGLYTGLVSADHCADVLVDALDTKDFSEERLAEYHQRWQNDIGDEISKGLWMQRIYRRFNDDKLDSLFDTLRERKIMDVVGNEGDIDYPSALARSALKTSPKLLKFAGPLIKSLF